MTLPGRPLTVMITVLWTLAIAVALARTHVVIHAQSPFPERRGLVANGTTMALSEARLESEFAERIGDPYDLDGLVLVVDDCRPDPEVYLDQALVAYDLAPRAGAMYDDVFVWLVCLEPRFTGFFFAGDSPHAGALDAAAAADVMVRPLGDGNFTGAFTASIVEVAGQLSGGASGGRPESAAPPTGTTIDDGNGGGRPWLTLLAGAAAAGGAAVWWRRRGGTDRGDGAGKTPATLREFERSLDDLGTRLTPESSAVARLVLAHESLGDEAMLEVHRRHQAMVERLATLQSKAAQLHSEAAAEEAGEGDSAARLAEAIAELETLEAYVHDVEREADHVEMLEAEAPVLLVDARAGIDAARETYGLEASTYALPATERAVALAVALADEGEAALTAGRRVEAGRAAEGAKAVAEAVAGLPGALREANAVVDEVAVLFPRLERYAEQSWADVRGNGSEAEESLDAAVAMFERMATAERATYGADPAAGFVESLARVHDELDRARRLAEAVRDRLTFLDRAREQSASSLDAVDVEIAEARAWIAQPEVDADVSEAPERALAAAEALLAETRLAMNAPQPDWIGVMRAINRADRMADEALAGARSEHERMAALRRQMGTARTDAVAAIERSRRYLAAHGRDVPSDAPSRVATAREELATADRRAAEAEAEGVEDALRARGLLDAAAAYQRAGQEAEAAYEMMATAVAREERERAYVPRETWMGPVVPTPGAAGPIVFGSAGHRDRIDPPPRQSSWGSRPPSTGSGGRGSSSRRGGGRGW